MFICFLIFQLQSCLFVNAIETLSGVMKQNREGHNFAVATFAATKT